MDNSLTNAFFKEFLCKIFEFSKNLTKFPAKSVVFRRFEVFFRILHQLATWKLLEHSKHRVWVIVSSGRSRRARRSSAGSSRHARTRRLSARKLIDCRRQACSNNILRVPPPPSCCRRGRPPPIDFLSGRRSPPTKRKRTFSASKSLPARKMT